MRTLLIADDERTIREGIATALPWESYGISRILLAADGKEAYELIIKERPEIAILDIIMPEMTGIEVISCFKNAAFAPEFVIISGYEEFEYAREAIRNHVNNYILKPCDLDEIADTVGRIISKIENQHLLAKERQSLQERLDLLQPQAQEQIARNFLTGEPHSCVNLFRQVLNPQGQVFQLLLACPQDPDDYAKLSTLKRRLEQAIDSPGWRFGVLLNDCVVLIFLAEREFPIKRIVKKTVENAQSLVSGLKFALSEEGGIRSLPLLYKKTWEALKYSPPFAYDEDNIPLVEVANLHYCKTVRQVIAYAKDNLSDNSLTLSKIAHKILFLNPDYLGKLFKKECGVKFSDYLMRLRMEKAKQIIANSVDLKIYEVAQQVGLGNNAAYFGQVFRKYIGLLPSEYKIKHLKLLNFMK